MCGIFGFSGAQPVDITKIRWLAVANEDRGRSSTGIYTEKLDKKTTKTLVKNTDIANQFIDRMDVKEAFAGANLIQGHTRAATVGAVNDANAHPFEFNFGTKCIGAHNGFINDIVNKEHQYEKFGFDKEFPVDSCLIFATLSKYNGDYNKLSEMVGAIACSFVLPDKYPGILFLYKGYGRELHTGLSKEGVYYSSERTPLRHIGCVGINPVPDNSIMMLKNGELIDVVELKPTLVKFPLGTQRTNFEDKLSHIELKKIGIEKVSTPLYPHQGGGHYRKQSKQAAPTITNYSTTDDYVENQFRDKLGAVIADVKNEVDKLVPKALEWNSSNSYPFTDIDSCLLLVVLKASTNKQPRLAGWTIYGKEKHTIAGITAINGVTVLRFDKEDCDKEHTLVITDPMEEGPVFTFKVTPKAKSVMEVTLIIPFPQSDKGETSDNAGGVGKGNQSSFLWLGQSLLRVYSARFNESRSLLPASTKNLIDVQEPVQSVCSRTEGGEVSGSTCESGPVQRNPPNIAGVYSGVHLDTPSSKDTGGGTGGVHASHESIRIPPLTQAAMRSVLKIENERFLFKGDVLRLIRGQEYARTLSLWGPYLAAFINLTKLFADAAVLKLHDVATHGQSYGIGYYAYRILLQLSLDNYQLYRLTEENTKYVYQCLDNITAGRTYTEAVEKKSPVKSPSTDSLSHQLSLSFFKNFIEYCASITCNFGAIMYTTEKKEALIKVLKSQEALIEGQIENLQQVAHVFSTITTLKTLSVKAGLNSTIQGLRYNKLLISQFKEELQNN